MITAKNTPAPTRKELRKWAKMTDSNLHAEVRIAIARYFDDWRREEHFSKYLYEGEQKGYHTPEETGLYLDVTAGLLRDIYLNYGADVYKQVNDCL